jgi:GTP-binding protein
VEEEVEYDGRTRIAIVGKPNVGKSSFVNALLNEQRAIVTDIPGTTRDAIDIEFKWKDKEYLLIDTAGLRRKGKIEEEVERFSVARSLRAINRSDVVFLMIDAIEGISEQDKRIVSYITERGTGLVLIWTKWDLVEEKEEKFKQLDNEIELKVPFLKYVPYMTISNITRQRIFKTLELADQVKEATEKRIPTGELNRFLEEIIREHPIPTRKGKSVRIYYMTQASIKPTTFLLFCNNKDLLHWSYVRYVENALRDRFGFHGIPIIMETRGRKPEHMES